METQNKVPLIFDGNPTDTEWRSIEIFKKKAEQLFQCDILKNGNNAIKAHIGAEKGKPVVFQAQLPNEDSLKSLLLSFRPFYAKKEPSNFKRVVNIIKRYCRKKEVQEIADSYLEGWDNALMDNRMQFADRKGPITAYRILDLWFNGHYFHSEEDKNEELNSIKAVISEDFSKYLMVDSVYNCIKMINQIYNGIRPLKKP